MTFPKGRTALLAVLLLAVASPAHAACAWVLWEETSLWQDQALSRLIGDGWLLRSAHDSKFACDGQMRSDIADRLAVKD